jgi:hypothetical protein
LSELILCSCPKATARSYEGSPKHAADSGGWYPHSRENQALLQENGDDIVGCEELEFLMA